MPMTDLLLEGVELMLIGMGSVFVFLTLLVLALKGMSQLALTLQPETPTPPRQAGMTDAEDEQQLIAVISAAVSRYRSTRH